MSATGSRHQELGECPQISLEDAGDIIKEYDLDGDERLNFDEFSRLLMDQSDTQSKKGAGMYTM